MSFDESRLNELKTALSAKMTEQQAIADSMKIEGATLIAEPDKKAAFQQNMADIREIKGLIDDMSSLRDVRAWAETAETKSVAAEAAAMPSGRRGTIGQAFIDSAEFKNLQGGRAGANMHVPFSAKSLAVKDIYSDMPTAAAGSNLDRFGIVERDAMVTWPMRTRRVRDLFPVRTTNAAVIEFFRQTGFVTGGGALTNNKGWTGNNASVVPERNGASFGEKPQSTFSFVGHQSPVRTIAHWEAAHRNVLADEPQLRSIIDNELLYGLRLVEDAQILTGSGTGENLLGILSDGDIQSYDWSDGASTPVPDTKADALRRALTLSYLAHYEPTGIVVHPSDWEDIELTKNEQGTYLLAMSVAAGAESRVWRVPVIDTPAIPAGTALVGSFGLGAQIYDREAATIRVSEQHEDFFVRNAIVVLAEERLALAVKRPESFVKLTFDTAPPAV